MAAPRKTSQEADSDSSSSAEDLERFREAAWEPPGSAKKTVQFPENSASPVIPSLRVRPDSHEHDGNELQTTPEFRTHVAKKLATMLDNCIKEIPGSNSFNQESTASESEDEGFRLLTTSVPGDPGKIIPSPTLKRRVASSTSEDSEEEKLRRFREAAVSGLDILNHSALQTTTVDIMDRSSNNQQKKKAKKKRPSDEAETVDQNAEPEGKMDGFKKKKKKKKERANDKTETDDQTVNSETDKRSKKSESECHSRIETVKDESKKKKMGLCETASDPNISPCGKSGTKKKKKLVVENCNEHD
ncbi:protein CUSTOS isoform X2 [Hyla sarda]|uniref:protein CUSTOS isoform X2 n=1 Tax=Hyla sarda TaxID=327740 RepID=UPI0024C394CE|nr:protein CUSTOS isoform X2 [Hyla sarda]